MRLCRVMRVRTVKDLAVAVRSRRKDLKWSQQQLADQAEVTRLWIVQLEGGKATAQIGLVLRTLRVLGLHLDAAVEEIPGSEVDIESLLGDD